MYISITNHQYKVTCLNREGLEVPVYFNEVGTNIWDKEMFEIFMRA